MCSMLCHSVALIPGAGVRCPFLSSRASWQGIRAPPPLLLGLRASLYWPNQTRDSRNGRLLYPVRAVRCYLPAGLRIFSDASGSFFAAGCITKELSKTTVSFWLRMPLSQVSQLSVPERSVLCLLSSVHSCCSSVSSLKRTLLSSWWEGEDVALALVFAVCYLGAVAPWFLAAFHRSCVVAVQALVLPGLACLDISQLPIWRLALGPCFLVGSPTIRHHPMGCHGWRFVYVSTI